MIHPRVMRSYQKPLLGFTLVELIVVITIVGILSTVGFVSYSGYLTGARDSNRISQLTKLSDSLQVYSASKTLPLPDDSIEITASGTLIAYQGEVGVDVLETIDYTNGGKDPKDDSYYSYFLTKDRNSLQLMALMEEQQSVAYLSPNILEQQTHANFEDRFPKVYGRKLGILTYDDDSNLDLKNTPLEKISGTTTLDIVNTDTAYTANISDVTSDKITGTGSELMAVNPKASCKRIKQTGGASGNGLYTISPAGSDKTIYCIMENGEAIADMLEGEGDFVNGQGISTYVDSNCGVTDIVKIKSPISSGYAVHKTGCAFGEYQIRFKDFSKCNVGENIYMTIWTLGANSNMFHSYTQDSPDENYTVSGTSGEENARAIVDGNEWVQYQYIREYDTFSLLPFNWFIGYNNEDPSDLYFTGVRLSCY